MTQEEKELLLKDLSARLLYRVKCRIKGEKSKILIGIEPEGLLFRARTPDKSDWCYDSYDIEEWSILPYLRPMSSMTEEEKEVLYHYYCNEIADNLNTPNLTWELRCCVSNSFGADWLNAHHFDYRGLIEKGLALEAPEGMYKEWISIRGNLKEDKEGNIVGGLKL